MRVGGTLAVVRSGRQGSVAPQADLSLELVDIASARTTVVQLPCQKDERRAIHGVSFSPDGTALCLWGAGTTDAVLYVLDTGVSARAVWRAPTPNPAPCAWSASGSSLATFAYFPGHADPDRARVYTVDRVNGRATRFLAPSNFGNVVAWTPDGHALLLARRADEWAEDLYSGSYNPWPVYRSERVGGSLSTAFYCVGTLHSMEPLLGKGTAVVTHESYGVFYNDLASGKRFLYGRSQDGIVVGAARVSPDLRYAALPYLKLSLSDMPPFGLDAPPRLGVALMDSHGEGDTSEVGQVICSEKVVGLPPRVTLRWTPDSKYIVRCIASQWFPKPGEEGDEFADGVVDVIEVETGKRWEIFRVKGQILNLDWSPVRFEVKPSTQSAKPPAETRTGGTKRGGK